MKTVVTLICVLFSLSGMGQSLTDGKTFTLNTAKLKSFHLNNMDGKVNVVGTNSSKAIMKVTRTLKSASSQRLDEMEKKVTFDSMIVGDRIYFFMNHPELKFEIDEEGRGSYNSCNNFVNKRDRIEVAYQFEIELQVPKNMDLHVSNHRKDIKIKGIDGDLYARNHHNDLLAENLGGNVELYNHHGSIDATFTRNPTKNCVFKTHHGDINIGYQRNLSADVFLKTRHGEFYTDFDWQPRAYKVVPTKSARGTKYTFDNKTSVRIGSGGNEQDFSTWHGNIYLTKTNK